MNKIKFNGFAHICFAKEKQIQKLNEHFPEHNFAFNCADVELDGSRSITLWVFDVSKQIAHICLTDAK